MHANFSLFNYMKPDIAALSDAELENWGQGVARRQKIRSRVLRVLDITCMVAMVGVAISMVAFLGSLTSVVVGGPIALGLMRGFIYLADQCYSHETSPDTARLNAEHLRRDDLVRRRLLAPASPAFPFAPPPCAEDFAAAAREGLEKDVIVGRPLQLMKKSSRRWS